MSLNKSTRPRWATGDPSYIATPTSAKQDRGWRSQEKPPFQWMNWLFRMAYDWFCTDEDWGDVFISAIMRSGDPIEWDGADLAFSSDIEIHYKVGGNFYQANIPLEDSPITLADGEAIVAILPESTGDLISVAYALIEAGNYSEVDVGSITQNDDEREVILFRRRGTSLEMPLHKQTAHQNTTFYLGELFPNNDKAGLVPIGTVISFYPYDGDDELTYDTTSWMLCNGATDIVFGDGRTRDLPDQSGRYLAGFGTDGDGNIGSVAFSPDPVGNVDHQINIQHSHGALGATSIASGNQSADHTHGPGTLQFHTGHTNDDTGDQMIFFYEADGTPRPIIREPVGGEVSLGDIDVNYVKFVPLLGDRQLYTRSGSGATSGVSTNHTHNTDINHTHANALSTTQSIQPRSIRYRFLMRYR